MKLIGKITCDAIRWEQFLRDNFNLAFRDKGSIFEHIHTYKENIIGFFIMIILFLVILNENAYEHSTETQLYELLVESAVIF